MKHVVSMLLAIIILGTYVFAYESEVKILTQDEIVKLTDQGLIDAYIDVSVEIEASKSFHATSGFMPKEYRTFKELLRYRILLVHEIKKRKLELPSTQ